MAICHKCGKEYCAVIGLEECPKCHSGLGDKVVDVLNDIGKTLFG